MHSGEGVPCNLFVIETGRLVISLTIAENLPEKKRKGFFFTIPTEIMRIGGISRIVSIRPKYITKFPDWSVLKRDNLHNPQVFHGPISSVIRIWSTHVSR